MDTLVLASASPRRAKLLRQIGVHFEQIPSTINNERTDVTDPGGHVLLLSKRKAENVFKRIPEKWVLGADTVVVLDGCLIGKPRDRSSARHMLHTLSAREHCVYTGLTLFSPKRKHEVSQFEKTKVLIRRLSENEIEDYIATGEPMGKAGGYAIQGLGATLVERIEGCYYNVVGLPLVRLLKMMKETGFSFHLKPSSVEGKPAQSGLFITQRDK